MVKRFFSLALIINHIDRDVSIHFRRTADPYSPHILETYYYLLYFEIGNLLYLLWINVSHFYENKHSRQKLNN